MLATEMRGRGLDILTTREPGGTPLGGSLRQAFLETEEQVAPMAELLSFAADRAQHVEFLIRPALVAGRIVISDRYADATFAYQGAGRGFSEAAVNQVIELATSGLKPDLTLFFDITVDEAVRRMSVRDDAVAKANRMDAETVDFYERVRDAYLGIAEREPNRFRVVNGDRAIEAIHADVERIVSEFLE
jgi:dTMP kinase